MQEILGRGFELFRTFQFNFLKIMNNFSSQANYFDRADVALKNIAKWMFKQSEEERHHACTLMEYQNTRGGRVIFSDIPVIFNFYYFVMDALFITIYIKF